MKAAEQARLAYLGANQAECIPWDELKPEMRERWAGVVDACQPAPIRVPFSDAVIEKMAEAHMGVISPCANWEHADKQYYMNAIRAALAAGGIDLCAVPEYAPEDVAFSSERASVVELREIGVDAYLLHDTAKRENAGCMVDPMQAATIAVRARVEAPLLVEIADMKIHCDGRDAQVKHLESAIAKLHANASGLEDMVQRGNERWARVVGERESLRAQLEDVTAERDAANERAEQAEAEAADLRCESSLIGELRMILGLGWCESITERCRDLSAMREPVDPDAWKTPLELADEDGSSIEFAHRGVTFEVAGRGDTYPRFDPTDAARAAQWLASYAAAHGCPVSGAIQYKRSQANDGFVDMPTDAQVEALARVLTDAFEQSVGGEMKTWGEQTEVVRSARLAQARAAYAYIGRVPVYECKECIQWRNANNELVRRADAAHAALEGE